MTKRPVLPLVAVLSAPIFAITGTAWSASPPPPIDACALLAPSAIARVIGAAVEPGSRHDAGIDSNGAWSSSCLWTLEAEKNLPADPNAPMGGRSFVILNAMQWPVGGGRAHEFLDSFRSEEAKGDLPHALSPRHFGDEALSWGDGLAVRKGDVSFGLSIFLHGQSAIDPGVAEERLAPQVLEQLDRRAASLKMGVPLNR